MCSGTLGGSDSEGKVIRLDLCDFVLRVSSKHIYHCCFNVLKEVGDVHAIILPLVYISVDSSQFVSCIRIYVQHTCSCYNAA